ncbi:hypothetical protein [Cytobacillus sp. IB215665]|uniref:hypothetical protein n=1 Tax=Cytobacillus sp. IB215665 TaxID=3097357 RepID=UPI002A1631FE|nr:hypothetical protein [Cytobacillus sp. IB215665]MDX8365464.1 hypothetical protein [Cytobacillus sp. IB215665]
MIDNRLEYDINSFQSEKQVKELLRSCYGDDEQSKEYFLRGFKSTMKICSISVSYNKNLVGMAVAWKSVFHPYCTYISIAAKPLYIVDMHKLLKQLQYYCDDMLPLQTSIWETSLKLKNFYESTGFKEVRRTYNSLLDLSSVADLSVIVNELQLKHAEHSVVSLSDISFNNKLKEEIVMLIKKTYESTHTTNPLGIHDLNKWEQLIFNEDTFLEGSYIIVHKSNVLAFSLLHYSDDMNKLEFGWRGTKNGIDENLILLLTAYQIHFAKTRAYTAIEAEIDNTDPYSVAMASFFPFSPSPTLITYQR